MTVPSAGQARARIALRVPRPTIRGVVCALAGVVLVYLAIIPLITMIVTGGNEGLLTSGASGWTLDAVRSVFAGPGFGQLLFTSCLYSAAVAVAAVVVGFALAWVYVRTDAPGKSFGLLVAVGPLVVPGVLNTVAWTLLLAPGTGPINQLLQTIGLPQFDVYSMPGMIFVQATHVVPIAFLIAASDLASFDPSLEEAAEVCGGTRRDVLRWITWPIVRPAMLGAALLCFVQTLSSFEVPQLIGTPAREVVFGSRLFSLLNQFPPAYSEISVMGLVVLVISALGVFLARRLGSRVSVATISGKAVRAARHRLGRARWAAFALVLVYALATFALPLLMLLWSAFLPHYEGLSMQALHKFTLVNFSNIFRQGGVVAAFRNTLIAAVGTGIGVVVICGLVAYVLERSRVRGRNLMELASTAPLAIPGIVLGIGVLFWYLIAPTPFPVYGTILILILCFITISLPYGMRFLRPAISHIDAELDEAASVSGAGWAATMMRIYLPILRPAVASAFLFAVIVAFREVSSAVFLYTPGNQVVSVDIFLLFSNGEYTLVCALGTLVIVVLALAVLIVSRLSGDIRKGLL